MTLAFLFTFSLLDVLGAGPDGLVLQEDFVLQGDADVLQEDLDPDGLVRQEMAESDSERSGGGTLVFLSGIKSSRQAPEPHDSWLVQHDTSDAALRLDSLAAGGGGLGALSAEGNLGAKISNTSALCLSLLRLRISSRHSLSSGRWSWKARQQAASVHHLQPRPILEEASKVARNLGAAKLHCVGCLLLLALVCSAVGRELLTERFPNMTMSR